MVELEQFRANAEKEGICEKYALLWDKAGSKKQLMDLAMTAQGADFLCDSIAKGRGITSDLIVSKFKRYINGGYVAKMDLYTASVYCSYDDAEPIDAVESLYLFLNSRARVVIPKGSRTIILADAKSDIELVVGEDSVVRIYDGNDRVRVVEHHGNGIVKRFN